jgi:hypothetical protein
MPPSNVFKIHFNIIIHLRLGLPIVSFFVSHHQSPVLLTRYYPGDQLRIMKLKGHVAGMEKSRDACRILVGKPEGTRPFTR